MEPQVTITLREYNGLLQLKKGVEDRKIIVLRNDSWFPGTYYVLENQVKYFEGIKSEFEEGMQKYILDHQNRLNSINRQIDERQEILNNMAQCKKQPWYKRIF